MVHLTGHLGMALLWLVPAWVLLDHRKTAGVFVASGVLFGMVPDVDLVWYNDPVVNWRLPVAGVLVNVGLFLYLGRRSPSE